MYPNLGYGMVLWKRAERQDIRLVNLKGTIRHLGWSKKRTKFWFEILLGQILIMDINRFVFVLFLLLLFLFWSENADMWISVGSPTTLPRQNYTYLLFVLVSTLANVTSPGCEERGREQKHHKKDPTQWWFRQEDHRRSRGFFPHSFLMY